MVIANFTHNLQCEVLVSTPPVWNALNVICSEECCFAISDKVRKSDGVSAAGKHVCVTAVHRGERTPVHTELRRQNPVQ